MCVAPRNTGPVALSKRVDAALSLEPPLAIRGKLPLNREKAISYVSETLRNAIRLFWSRPAALDAERRRVAAGINSYCKPFASKVHPPLLQGEFPDLGMGGGGGGGGQGLGGSVRLRLPLVRRSFARGCMISQTGEFSSSF